MKVSELANKLNLTTIHFADERDVTGCYIGDLLSWVMGKAKSGDAWITIMSNVNIIAVATLADVACIILCEGINPDEDVIEKAKAKEINIFKTDLTAYELACLIKGEI